MNAQDYLTVGKDKQVASLGFGAMRMPNEAETAKMFDVFLDNGYNYIDTAYIYDGSEEMLKKTLVKRHPRDTFLIADKLPPWEVKKSPEDCQRLFEEQLRRTGLDYFDFYLVHSLDDSREKEVEDLGLFQWVVEQKKKGLVKHVGFSFHGGTAYLERVLKNHPEAEFVLLQQNYVDNLRGLAGEWNAMARKYNVPIKVMEPVKGGSLAALPAPAEKLLKDYAPDRSIASWAIQFAATLEGVTCVLSGMSNMEQLQDNIKTFKNLKPFTQEEIVLLEQVLAEMSKVSSIPCTYCKYCHNDCPRGIDIATCFSLYNELQRGSQKWNRSAQYRTIPAGKRADDCNNCKACLSHCPQKINIPKELGLVAKAL
jgi:predicted aldo/keto reductase-like oxidoreductase